MRTAVVDPTLRARVVARRALRYDAAQAGRVGADWVRAGSALARFGKRLVAVQDDALWLAWWTDAGPLQVEALPTDDSEPRLFDDKRKKPDFEAAADVRGRLFVFGSGSLPTRERIAILEPSGAKHLLRARSLYARLRDEPRFAGPQLNLEGALVDGARLVLFNRGNADALASGSGFDASAEVDIDDFVTYCAAPAASAPPALHGITQYRLGEVDGVRLTLTDAAMAGGKRYFVAAAEASPNAIADGVVVGTSFVSHPRAT